ncbi:MAG: TIGR03936 family radical SAM-associated protein [Planctomycetota bacterium]|jgi:radical SAM-linked protein
MQEKVYTLIADFAIRNRLAYLSHQETLTLFQRALIRGQVPIAFSRGFNPRPRLSIPLPRSVGAQSQVERICAILSPEDEWTADSVQEQIAAQLPDDCQVHTVQCLEGKHTAVPQKVRYRFSLADQPNASQSARFQECQSAIETAEPIEIERYWAKKKRYRMMDISEYLVELVISDQCVEVLCRVSQAGTVRVDELMGWLGIETGQLAEPVNRVEIHWQEN